MENLHATTVDLSGAGILIIGDSASGKSDLALRLIENKGALLVCDDQTILQADGKNLIASCPQNIQGLIEVRGIGIIKTAYTAQTTVKLAVIAQKNPPRYPDKTFFENQGICLPSIFLNLLEASAPDKVVVKLKTILEEQSQKP